ncbi:Hypothetical protein AA314_07755 [Archangium gephyra]|uniref:Uncharacterized protein n=1 Tax=Archangium gephyra TaxID=48 RepID=A0AAC8QEV9_9BACT|nr:Hypothetical protein AA314_07755 [Archangium gephyra]
MLRAGLLRRGGARIGRRGFRGLRQGIGRQHRNGHRTANECL